MKASDENGRGNGVGGRIRALRKTLDLTAGEFGQKVGVDASTVARWEQGAAVPTQPDLAKVWKALNVDLNWLLVDSYRPGYLNEVRVQNGRVVDPLIFTGGRETQDAVKIVTHYRAMDPDDRAFVNKVFDSVLESPREPEVIDVTPGSPVRRK